VVRYTSILDGSVTAGQTVVVIGGGGIGHDVALYLARGGGSERQTLAQFEAQWGIGEERRVPAAKRTVTMVKRSPGPFGRTLGKSTGWILRQELKDLGVRQIAEASYLKIDAGGLHIAVQDRIEVLQADTVVVCAGQLSARTLADALDSQGQRVHVIGGARLANELDAKRAIHEGALVGNQL
jgi:2,4-dienoyl-CoA reductase (NADPH2)